MKYWLLTTEYPPFYGGGIGTYCYHTAHMLSNKGHEVSIFIPDFGTASDIVETIANIRIIRFSVNKTKTDQFLGYSAYLSYEFAITIREYFTREGNPDLIEVQDYQGIGYYLLLFKHLVYEGFKELTILTTLHVTSYLCLKYNNEPVYKFPTFWTGEMEKFAILASDIVISPSKYILEKLNQDFRLEEIPVHVLPNPIETNNASRLIPDINRNEIVFFGKLVYLKGCFELLEYFSALWDNGFAHPLKMIGDGDFILHSEGIIAKDYVTLKYKKYIDAGLLVLLGKLSPEKVKEQLSSAHVIIIPSIFDNLPYTVLEAMLNGKIVLASDQGGHIEVIEDGKDGFIFTHAEPGNFENKLKHILSLSNQEIAAIGEKARRKVSERFNTNIIFDKKMQVLESALKNHPKKKNGAFPFIRQPQSFSLNGRHQPLSGIKNLLSIVIPYYNMGNMVFDAVRSIRASGYSPIEVLVINDGSDEPASINALEGLRKKFPEVILINNPNNGLAYTRNYGAEKATGEFLAFLDADDTVEPSYYQKAVNVLKAHHNIHYVGCWVNYYGSASGTWPTFTPEPPYFLVHNSMNSSALVFKKESFLMAGLNDTKMPFPGFEDWDSILQMTSQGLPGVSLPEPLFNYRVRKESMFRKLTKVKTLSLYNYIAKKHESLYSKYTSDIISILNANGPAMNYDNPTFEYFQGDKQIISNKTIIKLKRIVGRSYLLKKIALKIKRIIE